LTVEVGVYIKDVDELGIVYHPRYIEWAASVREQHLRDLNLSFSVMQSYGFNLVTAKMQVHFKQIVELGEVLEVKTLTSDVKLDRLFFFARNY